MEMIRHNDTIVAQATAAGVGAIGVIRLSGPGAMGIIDRLFTAKDLLVQASHTLHVGFIEWEGRALDEVVISLFRGPRSYTGEDVVEISCHGSPFVLQRVMQVCVAAGARPARPGEFTQRAFLNGRLDLTQAEAVADIIASESSSAHTLAINQLRGGVSNELKQARAQLLDFASLIELELDFSEEDVEFADRSALRNMLTALRDKVEGLRDSFQLGNAIKTGVPVVIAGRPNAGKSTLLNALLNEERALVSHIAGTTRDTIEEVLTIEGIQFRIIDTAGIRETADTVEAMGVARTLEKVKQARILIYLFDPGRTGADEVRQDIATLREKEIHLILCATKTDLDTGFDEEKWRQLLKPSGYSLIGISAKTGGNLAALKAEMLNATGFHNRSENEVLITNLRHFDALQKVHQSITELLTAIDADQKSDLLSIDIRQCMHWLGEITGEINTEEILGNIFSKFCIGK